ncbi:MAG TPA: DUF1232 domain-containing protein [Acidimicrobiia bacterium]|nr:DUF1232 domain-containing protein [Acidimicrobiia bacterium]
MLPALRETLARAEAIIRNPKELLRLLTIAERRLDRVDAGRLRPVKKELQTMLRLMRAYGDGRYRHVSGKNLGLAGLALLYLVSPLDVLPDFLPGGFVDDAAVIGFIVKTIRAELAAFEAWERGKRSGA